MTMPPLPELSPLEITQSTAPLDLRAAGKLDALIVVMPAEGTLSKASQFPGREHIVRLRRHRKDDDILAFTDTGDRMLHVVAGFAKTGASSFERLTLARKLMAEARRFDPATVGLHTVPADDATIEALVAAAHAARFRLPQIKQKAPSPARLKRLRLFHPRKLNLARTEAAAAGNNLARWLTGLPANYLTPTQYRDLLEPLAKREGWQFEFLDEKALAKRGAGAFLAVTQGSSRRDAGIAHLRYQPTDSNGGPVLALVGKGICFDTGGINIKSAKSMFGMHGDMQGSAVALGTLLALSRLEVDFPVDAWLAIATNDIGPSAYRQNEVVTALNGTTIEIVHTDAEGRMALSDTLALASQAKPALLIDYATLTGTCVDALSTRYTGAVTNGDALNEAVIAAGRASGERVWPFPADADFDAALKSDVADIKQCAVGSEADQIRAARFLSRFVGDSVPWVHLDLSAGESKGGLAHVPTEVTGFGVRFTLELLGRQSPFAGDQ
ncbi:MAG TPA: leucyl aminopeptidase family protein [Gammaproteobacteria bacterium]|nr:leucyl aminopeptidase family protein [Gammaproteobacteria bacterium]